MTRQFKHGEIWLANLNPGRGTEPGKVRPVLLLQNQALLDVKHPSSLIIPLTTNLVDDAEPLRLRVKAQGGLDKDSDLLIDQLRAIDNKRLIDGPLLQLDSVSLLRVYQAVTEVLGMEIVQ
jgi:mRNA interferase MazF